MKLLQISDQNISGLLTVIDTIEKELGNESRFITLYPEKFEFGSDICLNYPIFRKPEPRVCFNSAITSHNDKFKENLRNLSFDIINSPKVIAATLSNNLLNFDSYIFHGGKNLSRTSWWPKLLKIKGKKIFNIFHGTEIRSKKITPKSSVYKNADCNITFHPDLKLYEDLEFIPLPFIPPKLNLPKKERSEKIRIGHAPTSRVMKGTLQILKVLNELKKEYPIEVVLIENKTHEEALKLIGSCDIMVDQVKLGMYGLVTLEAASLGVVSIAHVDPFGVKVLEEEGYGKPPILSANEDTIQSVLEELILDRGLLKKLSREQKSWIERVHNPFERVKDLNSLMDRCALHTI